jgi:hypothetical protein
LVAGLFFSVRVIQNARTSHYQTELNFGRSEVESVEEVLARAEAAIRLFGSERAPLKSEPMTLREPE